MAGNARLPNKILYFAAVIQDSAYMNRIKEVLDAKGISQTDLGRALI